MKTILFSIAGIFLAGPHWPIQAALERYASESDEKYMSGRTQVDAISIIKIRENDHIVYGVVVVPSYLTRTSKIHMDRVQRYPTLDEAIVTVQKHLNATDSYSHRHLVSDNCLPLLHDDPDKIMIMKFTKAEKDKLKIYRIVTGDR